MTVTYQAVPGVLTREVGGELLLLNSDSELYFALNSSGAAMYDQLVQRRPLSAIVDSVSSEFGEPADTVAADLETLVARLLDKGLIRPDA